MVGVAGVGVSFDGVVATGEAASFLSETGVLSV